MSENVSREQRVYQPLEPTNQLPSGGGGRFNKEHTEKSHTACTRM